MAESKKRDLDETTVRIARRLLNMPPKPHEEMKLGKQGAKGPRSKNKTARRRHSEGG
jgi:hypothetical protein